MLIPLIEKFQSPVLPWNLYRGLYSSSEVSFFLDSGDYQPPDRAYSYIGTHPFLEVSLEENVMKIRGERNADYQAHQAFEVLRELLDNYRIASKSMQPFLTGGAVGFLSYELVETFERIQFRNKPSSNLPLFFFGFYRDLIVYDHKKSHYYLVTHYEQGKGSKKNKKEAQKRIEALKASFERSVDSLDASFALKAFRQETSKKDFLKNVETIQEYIRAGDIYQANLSQRFNFEFEGSSLKLYEDLRNINPSPFASFLKIRDTEVVSNSPERLIRKQGRLCQTRPIAGTRPSKVQHLDLDKAQSDFLQNEKERAEHIMLVDLERNDLGRVCDYKSVKVEEMMAIERYSHVMHIVSNIKGKMKKNKDALDLIQAMFPGGTITGCPKIRCMEIIDELEPTRRGLYTGSIGYLDFNGDMDLNIVIRTILLQKNKGQLQVGAGIVYDSDPEKEYQETLHKGEALTEALAQLSY